MARNGRLFEYLQNGHKLTALKWMQWSWSMSLAKRIYEIREDQKAGKLPGWINSVTIRTATGKPVSQYSYQP